MRMTKQHFETFARLVAEAKFYRLPPTQIIDKLIEILKKSNPKFNIHLFEDRVGRYMELLRKEEEKRG